MAGFNLPHIPTSALCAAFAAIAGLVQPVSAVTPEFSVREGESIQAMIDQVPAGAKIIVEKGTYQEQLSIGQDHVTLVGQDAIIVPPDTPINNACTDLHGLGLQIAICIHGSDIHFEPDDELEYAMIHEIPESVQGVSVSGFTIKGFSSIGVAVIGADDTIVSDNKILDNLYFGAFAYITHNTTFSNNVITSSSPKIVEAGIANTKGTEGKILNNEITGYDFGVYERSLNTIISDNIVRHSCIGFQINHDALGALVKNNHFSAPNVDCINEMRSQYIIMPAYGVAMIGANRTEVRNNTILDTATVQDPDVASAGIVIMDVDNSEGDSYVAHDNLVKENKFLNNFEDMLDFSEGTGNVFTDNFKLDTEEAVFPKSREAMFDEQKAIRIWDRLEEGRRLGSSVWETILLEMQVDKLASFILKWYVDDDEA